MLSEVEIRAIAQEVVRRAKGTAHVDTGALKRSISYTYVRQVVIFRELFYGQFGDNSELEKIARKLISQLKLLILNRAQKETIKI